MRLFTFDKTKLSEIFFFEADRNYTTVYYGNGHRDVYTIPLKRFHEFLLHEPDFVRIHKSYLVNRQFIKTIARRHILLHNGMELPVARRRKGVDVSFQKKQNNSKTIKTMFRKLLLLICLIGVGFKGLTQQKKIPQNLVPLALCDNSVIGCNLFNQLATSQLVCSNNFITYAGPVGNSCIDGATNTNWNCIVGRKNQTWFYVKALTTGTLRFNFTNSANVDVDGIIWGPLPNNDFSQACNLTTQTPLACDYNIDADVQLPCQNNNLCGGTASSTGIPVQAGQIFIMCILNFADENTNITISQPTGGSVQYCMAPPVTQNCVFADCNSSTNCGTSPAQTFTAIDYLCQQQIIKGYTPQDIPNNRILSPSAGGSTNIARIDLAKIALLSLLDLNQRVAFANNPSGSTFNAENFPVPFADLQKTNSNTDSIRYAKVLSYLEYADNLAPFDRNQVNFNPTGAITRALVLKVLLEAWNIDEFAINNGTPLPFTDPNLAIHPQYRYIKKAHELGIVTGSGGAFNPDANCTREDAFLMLYRMMVSTTIPKPTLTQINTGFFVPGQYRPDNLGVGVGTDRGNFNHYTKTSFAMDGVVPLVFAHSYNSYATELPNQLYPNYLGRGWTHSFNCYVSTIGSGSNVRMIVHYPDGKLHFYKPVNGTLVAESIGVFDQVTATTATSVTITTPSKIVYYFEKASGQADNYWLIKTIKDRNNNTLTFTNELGINNNVRLKSVADPTGRTMNFVYRTGEARNYLAEVNLSGVGAFNGRKIEFSYSTSAWDGDGIKDLTAYKENDKNGVLKTTSYAYYTLEGSEHLLKTITLPKGNVIDNTYEKRKLKSSQTLNGATVVQQMNTNWTPTYNSTAATSTGAVTVTAGGTTKTTNYTHNNNGLAQTIKSTGTNPMDLTMTYGVSADPTAVNQITQTAASVATNVTIAYHTTAPYNVSSVTTVGPNGNITQSYTYNSFNDILSFTNGRGKTTTFGYNATGNLTSITHPLGQPTVMERNPNGTILKVTTPAGVVTNFTYNTYGNLLTTSTPNGASPAITTSATYDALSRVTSKTDARNQTVTYDYFANDLLKKMNAPLSYFVEYNYDANDNNTTVTNAKNNATTNTYHPQTDQLMSRSFGSKTEFFTYNEDGSLKTFTNGRNQTFAFTYDPSGRITGDSYATYTYNPEGTLNTVTHTQGAKTYTLDYDYDVLRRLTKTTCDGFAVQYRYDNNNNLDLLTYPDGKTVAYAYDNKDRITTVTDWAGRVTTYVYDDDGKVLNYTLPNGSKAIYSYDAAGRPTGISHQKSSNAVICSSSFVLDQGGNHLEENIIEPYTSAPALTAGTTPYVTNARNETTQVGSAINTFDGNGATTSQAGQALTWDTKDNLLTAYGKTFYYDGNETRRAKTGKRFVINELSNSVIAETNDAGSYLYFYVYGPTGLLYRQSPSGVIEYYHYDFRGSTIAMTDASQNTVRQYQYDAYGKILQQTPAAATDDNPFRYVGQYGVQYEESNLYFMRARYYDPTTGKFLSEDPIWSTNLFAYADNNPVNFKDPNGLSPDDIGWGAVGSTSAEVYRQIPNIYESILLEKRGIEALLHGRYQEADLLLSKAEELIWEADIAIIEAAGEGAIEGATGDLLTYRSILIGSKDSFNHIKNGVKNLINKDQAAAEICFGNAGKSLLGVGAALINLLVSQKVERAKDAFQIVFEQSPSLLAEELGKYFWGDK